MANPDLDSVIDPIVYGPSGTGKELVVKYFSKKLDRSNIVVIDCAQRSDPGIISSQIFGSKFGDYTGAVDQEGFIEQSKDGVCQWDEFQDILPDIQGAVLRFLESKKYKNLTGAFVSCNARHIFTTNAWIPNLVKEKKFREDLFGRIWCPDFVIRLSPLKERKEDIPAIINHYMWHNDKKYIHYDVLQKLINYDWPNNTRELFLKLKSIKILSRGCDTIDTQHVNFYPSTPMSIKTKYATASYIETTEYEKLKKGQNKILLKELLEFYDFDVKKIAALLKLHQSTIYRRMKKYGIERQ